jgi:hypothetical protein
MKTLRDDTLLVATCCFQLLRCATTVSLPEGASAFHTPVIAENETLCNLLCVSPQPINGHGFKGSL